MCLPFSPYHTGGRDPRVFQFTLMGVEVSLFVGYAKSFCYTACHVRVVMEDDSDHLYIVIVYTQLFRWSLKV